MVGTAECEADNHVYITTKYAEYTKEVKTKGKGGNGNPEVGAQYEGRAKNDNHTEYTEKIKRRLARTRILIPLPGIRHIPS